MKVCFSTNRATHAHIFSFLVTLSLVLTATLFSNAAIKNATAQDTTVLPFRKDTLLKLVQSKQYKTDNIIKAVEAKGVDFSLTDSVASEFRAAGAFPELLEAIRSNYRPTNIANAKNNTNNKRTTKTGTPPPDVRRNTSPYDDLLDRARDKNTDRTQVARILQSAINLNPARPEAYQLMGSLELYNNNFAEAERYMRAAIGRGGDAVFRVYHDHANGTFSSYCTGSLYVSKNSLKYEADKYNSDGSIDSYEARFSDIDEAKINSFVGRQYGAFHIKVTGSKRGNYNFAPATKNATESRLIVGLMQSK